MVRYHVTTIILFVIDILLLINSNSSPIHKTTQTADSLLHALDGGRLVLVILLSPTCNKGATIMHDLAAYAAELLDDFFLPSSSSSHQSTSSILSLTTTNTPLIGIMDDSTITDEFRDIFGTVTHYPALKYILTFPENTPYHDEVEIDDDDDIIVDDRTNYKHIQIWDYIGPKETAKQLFESVVMYWYRLSVTYSFLGHVKSSIDDADEESNIRNPPIFTFSSHHEMKSFLQSHGDRLLRPSQARRKHDSKLESEVFHFYMGTEERGGDVVGGIFHTYEFLGEEEIAAPRATCNDINKIDDASLEHCGNGSEFTQEIDPYVLIVQCRSTIDYGTIDLGKISVEELMHLNKQRKAMRDFEELAIEMTHRTDVAFVALDATTHDRNLDNFSGEVCGKLFGEVEDSFVGFVAFMKIRRYVDYSVDDKPIYGQDERQSFNGWDQVRRRVVHRIRTDWNDMNHLSSHPVFFPRDADESISEHISAVEYVQSSLVASTIVHTTPTVAWFDKDRMSQLAFPWYRKVHAVLFVDMGFAYKEQGPENFHRPPWPASLNNSTEAGLLLRNQRKAIRMFYDAAQQHRMDRPSDDVVFLIVPSSEVRIMTTFGIDIWTPLDESLFGTGRRENDSAQSILPVMMITDSSGRYGKKSSSRYYLCSHEIAKKTMQKGGAIGTFIDSFFNGTIGQPFVRSDAVPTSIRTPEDPPNTSNPNVTVLTGNTFESLVMDRDDEHTMLLLQSNSCGHCKRFSIFWNELSTLVQAMNWSSVIKVMKIDVSTNDVPHDMVNAWALPSVYYFPAHEKNKPIELPTPSTTDGEPQHLTWVTCGYDIVKWMIDQGRLDLENLQRLDGSMAESMKQR
jgi:hypothetical protein